MNKSSHRPTSATRADVLSLSAAAVSNVLLLTVGIELILGASVDVISVTSLAAVMLMVTAFRALRHLPDTAPAFPASSPRAGDDQPVGVSGSCRPSSHSQPQDEKEATDG